MKVRAEIIAPAPRLWLGLVSRVGQDGASDSFWAAINSGTRAVWHTGQPQTWGWSGDSPEMTAPLGESKLQLWGREDGIKVGLVSQVVGARESVFPPCHLSLLKLSSLSFSLLQSIYADVSLRSDTN